MSAIREPDPADAPKLATIAVTPGSEEGEWIVRVHGEIDVSTSPALRRELTSLLDGGASTLVLDLHETNFIDSAGLGVLVGALGRVRDEQGGAIVLRGLQDPVRRVLEITGLTELFGADR